MQPLLPRLHSEPKFRTVHGSDDSGEWTEQVLNGYTEVVDCVGALPLNPASVPLLKAALRVGPQEAVLRAVTRLAAHKHFTAHEGKLSVLLHDYVKGLADYPEFVVLSVCDYYREKDTNRFAPPLGEMNMLCGKMLAALRRELERQQRPVAVPKPKPAEEPFKRLDEQQSKRTEAWLALSRTRDLTADEIAAWTKGEMPKEQGQ